MNRDIEAKITLDITEDELRKIIRDEIDKAMDTISKRVEQYIVSQTKAKIVEKKE